MFIVVMVIMMMMVVIMVMFVVTLIMTFLIIFGGHRAFDSDRRRIYVTNKHLNKCIKLRDTTIINGTRKKQTSLDQNLQFQEHSPSQRFRNLSSSSEPCCLLSADNHIKYVNMAEHVTSMRRKKKDRPLCVAPLNLTLTHRQDQSATKHNHFSEQERICQVITRHYGQSITSTYVRVKHLSITYHVPMQFVKNELHKDR